MMLGMSFILGQRDDDSGIAKFIFGAIIFLIWVIGAIASAIKKKQEQERRQRVREQLERQSAPPIPSRQSARRPVELAPEIAMRIPATPKARPPARPAQRAQPKQRRTTAKPPPVPFAQVRAREAEGIASTARPVTATEISAPQAARSAPSTATAHSIARWLTPRTLRQQFILTEILQPPLSLRESRN